jgi:hypothetical protein
MKNFISIMLWYVVFVMLLMLTIFLVGKYDKPKPVNRNYYTPPEKCIDGLVYYAGLHNVTPKIVRDADGTSGISYVFCKEGGER